MEIIHIKSEKYHIVELVGRLDALNNAKMEDFFNKITENPELNILVDCEKLDFINSSGLRVFILSLKKMKSAKKLLVLCNLQKNIKDVFTYSGFTNLFDIELDKQSALKLV
jgi:anti-sigma B factor antagonist